MMLFVCGLMPIKQSTASPNKYQLQVRGVRGLVGEDGHDMLGRLLQKQGFRLCGEKCPPMAVYIKMSSRGMLLIRQGRERRSFRIPQQYKAKKARVQAIATLVSMFIEIVEQRRQPLFPVNRRRVPPPKRRLKVIRKRRQPKARKRAPVRRDPITSPVKRARPRPPVVPVLIGPAKSSSRAPRVRQAPPVVRSGSGVGLFPRPSGRFASLQRYPRRPPWPKALPPSKRMASALVLRRPVPPPVRTSQWRFGIVAGGLAGLQDLTGRVPLGGMFGLFGGVDRWSLELSVSLQPLLLPEGEVYTSWLGRAELVLAWYPIRAGFRLSLELGGVVEWIHADSLSPADNDFDHFRGGGLIGVRLGWQVHQRVALFVRPCLLLFPEFVDFFYGQRQALAMENWRVELLAGIQVRLW